MFLHITVNELREQLIILYMLICFYNPLYCDIISLTSLIIIQAFHLLLGFAENQGVFWDFKSQNRVRITEGSDNGDSSRFYCICNTLTSDQRDMPLDKCDIALVLEY